jgi:hypothetical protein
MSGDDAQDPFLHDPQAFERLIDATPHITCPRCGLTSFHPKDISEGYCARCHDWTSEKPGCA